MELHKQDIYLNMFTIPVGFFTPAIISGGSYDPDAQAFFDQAAAVGGTLTTTEKDAVNQLVIDLKADGIWANQFNIYPFVGSSAVVCELNLKSPTDANSTLNWNGTWSYSNLGIKLTSASGYASNTGWSPNAYSGDHHVYRYISTITDAVDCEYDGAGPSPYVVMGKCSELEWFSGGAIITVGGTGGVGFAQGINRTSTTSCQMWREIAGSTGNIGISWSNYTTDTSTQGTLTSNEYQFGRANTLTDYYNQDSIGFYSLGTSLTTQEMQDLHAAVSKFATTLGRDYAPYDSDAHAYIEAIKNAGGTLTGARETAITSLFIDLKSAGLYSEINAMWPMMGGATASAVIEAKGNTGYNLQFFGGMTVDATGAAGNGTNAYALLGDIRTGTGTQFTANSYSFGFNQVTQNTPALSEEVIFGQSEQPAQPTIQIATRLTGSGSISFIRSGNNNTAAGAGNTAAAGTYILNRNNANDSQLYKDASQIINVNATYTNGAGDARPLALWNFYQASNIYYNSYANQKLDFFFWGEGLTGGQITALDQIMKDWTTNIQ